MCARTGGDQRHHLAVLGADDGYVASGRIGNETVPVIRGELDHVWHARALDPEIDGRRLLQRGAVDVDDMRPLIHSPDLIIGRQRYLSLRAGCSNEQRADQSGREPHDAGAEG